MKYSVFENIHFDFLRKFRASKTLKIFSRQIFVKDTSLDAEFYVEEEYVVVFATFLMFCHSNRGFREKDEIP